MMRSNRMAAVDGAKFLIEHVTRKLNRIQEVFAIIGILYTSRVAFKIAYQIVSALRTHVWSRIKPVQLTKYGQWAVVTGCTDGIGKAYCQLLAKRGMNILLISRNLNKLQNLAVELECAYSIKTDIVQADFSEGKHIFSNIAMHLKDKDIGILVNNVGIMYEYPMLFEEVSEETLWQHVLLNVGAVTMMTHMVLPIMVKKGRGAIINMSSSSTIYPLPMMAVYSATKAYVDHFTRAIQYEYKGQGIDIQCLVPFYISTAMTGFSGLLHRLKFMVPDAPTFASHALMTLGHAKRTTGYWSHGLQYVACDSVPECVWLLLGFHVQKFLRRDADITKKHMLSLDNT